MRDRSSISKASRHDWRSGKSYRRAVGCLLALFLTALAALGQSPRLFAAVELARFEATTQTEFIKVEWETGSELETAAFRLFRSAAAVPTSWGDPVFTAPAEGGPTGKVYTYEDRDVNNGTTYFYRLEDISTGGAVSPHGPVSALFGTPPAGSTATPTATATNQGGATATRTRMPTRVPATGVPPAQPTATRRYTNTPSLVPTFTSTPVLPGQGQSPLGATPTRIGPAVVTTPTRVGGPLPLPTLAPPTPFVVATARSRRPSPAVAATSTVAAVADVPATQLPTATPTVRVGSTASVFEVSGTREGVATTASGGAETAVAGRSMEPALLIAGAAIALSGLVGGAVYLILRSRR